ncbi:NUDIX hydrolase [Orrella sp. NBD-18]|uniref:NUDIX hydrolase n=1 Tax=Sheuella amnicola TaxID=2707330 RepID=A0A6B2QUQ5_9BURK|nr:NUDIX domain-containing protein [Sheuella amnicola]NDY81633.1 NUDIX hydrolase [Sheuella amnicola]HBI83767.1 hypothetical protein [Alcaligenaceae bacterium]
MNATAIRHIRNPDNPYYHFGVNPTVDLMVVAPDERILLIRRSETSEACAGLWALPGGFIGTDAKRGDPWEEGKESAEFAARRELREETNLDLPPDSQIVLIGTYEGNQRDPRDNEESWTKTYAYLHRIHPEVFHAQKNQLRGMDDASDVAWLKLSEIISMHRRGEIAFDHMKIILDAMQLLR